MEISRSVFVFVTLKLAPDGKEGYVEVARHPVVCVAPVGGALPLVQVPQSNRVKLKVVAAPIIELPPVFPLPPMTPPWPKAARLSNNTNASKRGIPNLDRR